MLHEGKTNMAVEGDLLTAAKNIETAHVWNMELFHFLLQLGACSLNA